MGAALADASDPAFIQKSAPHWRSEEVPMAIVTLPAAHRTWEDWVGIAFGSLIVVSPLFVGQTVDEAVVLNTGLIGTVVLALAALQLADLHRWEELAELASGLWLIASPFVF